MSVKRLVAFIKEREKVRIAKEAGKPRPWTKDPILNTYRFCNVHREDDRVSKWLRANWYPSFDGEQDVWFAAVVARLFNYPDSLLTIAAHTLPFRPGNMRTVLATRKARGLKNFNAAYIVSTNGVAMDKVDYLIDRVLKPLWQDRATLRPRKDSSLEDVHAKLMQYDGLGSFIAAQIVADLKYMPPLNVAYDWDTFASSGPGSRRGLNRYRGYAAESAYNEAEWRADLEALRDVVNAELTKAGWKALHAQDLQNCLCEFDKYERARLGEGTPKQIYKESE